MMFTIFVFPGLIINGLIFVIFLFCAIDYEHLSKLRMIFILNNYKINLHIIINIFFLFNIKFWKTRNQKKPE